MKSVHKNLVDEAAFLLTFLTSCTHSLHHLCGRDTLTDMTGTPNLTRQKECEKSQVFKKLLQAMEISRMSTTPSSLMSQFGSHFGLAGVVRNFVHM